MTARFIGRLPSFGEQGIAECRACIEIGRGFGDCFAQFADRLVERAAASPRSTDAKIGLREQLSIAARFADGAGKRRDGLGVAGQGEQRIALAEQRRWITGTSLETAFERVERIVETMQL